MRVHRRGEESTARSEGSPATFQELASVRTFNTGGRETLVNVPTVHLLCVCVTAGLASQGHRDRARGVCVCGGGGRGVPSCTSQWAVMAIGNVSRVTDGGGNPFYFYIVLSPKHTHTVHTQGSHHWNWDSMSATCTFWNNHVYFLKDRCNLLLWKHKDASQLGFQSKSAQRSVGYTTN